ncbi:oxidoreductase [Dyella sp. Tek66A03]|uniref:oxidoreductase n=1 Tax=Dyella sp. Tek66A03 TaxID=3458298 RepID=UPI00403EBB96
MSNLQTPLPSGFGASSTAQDVLAGIDLSGKTAIVTGGYSGIGTETTRALRAAGARVIVPARDAEKARAAMAGMDVEMAALDLADPASIDVFADAFLASGAPLHILINSAGIMACPLTRDIRGYEAQFATNHLGHFQLTARLWPALVRAGGARVIALSSLGHRYAAVDLDDPHFERRAYDRWIAYGQSKSANALFAVGLDARGKAHGVRAFSVHPGRIITDLARHMSVEELQKAGALDENGRPIVDIERGMKSTAQGAATSVWAASHAQLSGLGGVYCEDCDIAALAPDGEVTAAGSAGMSAGVRPWAVDPAAAEHLWVLSEQMTGVGI